MPSIPPKRSPMPKAQWLYCFLLSSPRSDLLRKAHQELSRMSLCPCDIYICTDWFVLDRGAINIINLIAIIVCLIPLPGAGLVGGLTFLGTQLASMTYSAEIKAEANSWDPIQLSYDQYSTVCLNTPLYFRNLTLPAGYRHPPR